MDTVLRFIPIETWMCLIPLLPLMGAAINGSRYLMATSRRQKPMGSLTSFIGVMMPVASFVITLVLFLMMTQLEGADSAVITGPLFRWLDFGQWTLDVGFKLDNISYIMTLVVTGVGSLIHLYSTGYMHDDEGYTKYFAYLNLFLFFMLILVMADSLVLMFVGWEGVGLCSYLLIGFWFDDPEKAKAGKKAFIVNRIGDFGFILGIFLIWTTLVGEANGEAVLSFAFIQSHITSLIPVATGICLLLFVGATGKSAQIPLYVWLPDAMAGPTPVSALIHAATMVTAGVYMVVRLNFLYILSPVAMEVVAITGAVTALFAATMALVQDDIKKVLAYSTVSQLGYMFLGAGVGAFSAAIFHVMTHAFFKAGLFLGAGSIIHAMGGEQRISQYGGLKKYIPVTFWTFMIYSIAIAGIYPFAGFFSKDEILWHAFHNGHTVLWAMGFVGAGLTAFYMFRLVGLTFFGKMRSHAHPHESSVSMLVPLAILAVLSFVGGWVGVPEAFGGHNRIAEFLAPLLPAVVHGGEDAHGLEMIMGLISTIWALHWAVVGWMIYVVRPDWPRSVAKRFSAIYRLLWNKYYIDELYHAVVIRPLMWISEKVLWKGQDATLIDSVGVHGSARAVQIVGRIVAAGHTGLVPVYVFALVVGAAAMVWWIM